MPGLSTFTTGLSGGTGAGLNWLVGGLGGPGAIVISPGVGVADRAESDILDRFSNPVLARVSTPVYLVVIDRSGGNIYDSAGTGNTVNSRV